VINNRFTRILGKPKPPVSCQNAGNWFSFEKTGKSTAPVGVERAKTEVSIPRNFSKRHQTNRFTKLSGLQREYSFSHHENRFDENRNTRKNLQWDHRKVYESPNFLVSTYIQFNNGGCNVYFRLAQGLYTPILE